MRRSSIGTVYQCYDGRTLVRVGERMAKRKWEAGELFYLVLDTLPYEWAMQVIREASDKRTFQEYVKETLDYNKRYGSCHRCIFFIHK